MKFDFSEKVVLVTGGAEKAGRYFSVQYAKVGADLVITHYKTPSEATATKEEIEKLGRKCLVVEADNGDVSQVENVIREIEKEFGHLDVILHNASNFNDQPIEQVNEKIWDSSMNIILKGVMKTGLILFLILLQKSDWQSLCSCWLLHIHPISNVMQYVRLRFWILHQATVYCLQGEKS